MTQAVKQIDKKKLNKSKLLPSRESAKTFYNYFKNSNELLNNRFKINSSKYIFNNDFSMYPSLEDDKGLSKKELLEFFFQILNKFTKLK